MLILNFSDVSACQLAATLLLAEDIHCYQVTDTMMRVEDPYTILDFINALRYRDSDFKFIELLANA